MKSWQSDKLDSNIEADLLISWLHVGTGGWGGGDCTSNWIYAMSDKNQKQICKYAHTHANEFWGRLWQRIFCSSNVSNFCSWLRQWRERERTRGSGCANCSMQYVCVCPWVPTSRWQPDALLDGNIKQNDDVATLQMALRVRRCQVPAAQVEVVYSRLTPHPYPLEQLHTLRCGEAGLDVGPIITRYTKQRPQAFRNALRRSQRQLRLKKSIKRQSTLREIERR